MAKSNGLGQALYVGPYTSGGFAVDVSGDTGSIDNCRGGPAPLVVTGIDKSAIERIGGRRDGQIDWTSWFNPAVGASFEQYKNLPTADVLGLFAANPAAGVGSTVAGILAKFADFPGNRGADGSFTFKPALMGNGFGLEWCDLYHPKATDASAVNGTSIDGAASSSFGISAYALLFSLTSGAPTPTLTDSADNVSFAAITGLTAFAAWDTVGTNACQRVQSARTTTVRRYTRMSTTGTFSNANWVGAAIRHTVATL